MQTDYGQIQSEFPVTLNGNTDLDEDHWRGSLTEAAKPYRASSSGNIGLFQPNPRRTDMEETLIAVMSLGFSDCYGLHPAHRFLSFRETMALAEKAWCALTPAAAMAARTTLRWGIVITAIGLALCIGLYPIGFLAAPASSWLGRGCSPTAAHLFGLGLVLI